MVDFPTRNNNVLDLILTNTPDKVTGVYGFDDILSTDHKLIKFVLNFKIPKTIVTNRLVYNFKNANWAGLREVLLHTPWDLCFVSNDVDSSWASWCDLFLSAIKDNVPTCKARDNRGHPWIDSWPEIGAMR